VLGERPGDRIDLVDVELSVAGEEVDARDAAHGRDLGEGPGGVLDGLSLARRQDRGQLARRRHHPLAPDVLVGVVEDLGAGRTANRSLDRRERERRVGAQRDLDVGQVLAERLDDAPPGQVDVRVEAGPRGGEVGDDVDADRRTAEAGLQDVGTVEGQGLGRTVE